MSTLQIIFIAKNKKNDESITVNRDGTSFSVKFNSSNVNGVPIITTSTFHTTEDVREYLLNVLALVVHDNDPCVGIQFFFPGSPSVLYKHNTLNKDEVWDTVLDNLDFWLNQPIWPQLPPISPILIPADVTKDANVEMIDLSEPDMKVEVNKKTGVRNVTVLPNVHTFFDEDGCPCSRFSTRR